MPGPQREHWLRHDFLTRHHAQAVLLGNRRQDQVSLHRGERVADTDARPAAKRQIGELGHRLFVFLRETFRPEFIRVVVPARVVMYHIRVDQDNRALRHSVAANNNVLQRLPPNRRDWRRRAPPRPLSPTSFSLPAPYTPFFCGAPPPPARLRARPRP